MPPSRVATERSLRCVLVGDQRTLIECAEVLLQRGHVCALVVTGSPAVAAWCEQRSLPWQSPQEGYAGLAGLQFDWLFSIANLRVLPPAVLAAPACGAINFHDGPLPDFAGLNAPSWGILQRVPSWRITWHAMTAAIDGGDVFATDEFAVAPDETSLSLNLRCMAAAARAFGPLLDALAEGTAHPVPQTGAPRLFRRWQRPESGCVLDWTSTAAELDALVRALDFGDYDNPLGTAKVLTGNRARTVARCRIDDAPGDARPGTLLARDHAGLSVATGAGVLTILELREADGRRVDLANDAELAALAVGAPLPDLGPADRRRLHALHEQCARHESFWVGRLRELRPADVPFVAADTVAVATGSGATTASERIDVAVPPAVGNDHLAALALTAVARLAVGADAGSEDQPAVVHVAWRNADLAAAVTGLTAFFADVLPLPIGLAGADRAHDAAARLAADLAATRAHGTFLRDLLQRDPRLRPAALDPQEHLRVLFVAGPTEAAIDLGPARFAVVVDSRDGRCALSFDPRRTARRSMQQVADAIAAMLAAAAQAPHTPLAELDLLGGEQRRRVLEEWNATAHEVPVVTIHELVARTVARCGDRIALRAGDDARTYARLDVDADAMAARLVAAGVRRGDVVGVHLDRGIPMVIAVLGILRAGGAYLPLDPEYPRDRIEFMVRDSGTRCIVTQQSLAPAWRGGGTALVVVEAQARHPATATPSPGREPGAASPLPEVAPADLAYVIYTSGSTGLPKGVLVEHRNVVNFFAGMDAVVPHVGEADGQVVWLAVTSLSFDISVLELLWTLTRGATVVVHRGEQGARLDRPVQFGLFYFSSNADTEAKDKYRLLLEGARFADAHGFTSVWTPERHFHAFGGLYPNPAVTGAAVAAITHNIGIRAGSIVLPLHHPARVAEDWAIVDNLCGGRVGLSIAPGWQPVDFAIRPEAYGERHRHMFDSLEVVRRLWRGEAVAFPDPDGILREVRTQPRPLQRELPVWVTAAGNPETFRSAGRSGANVLTHLLGQTVEEIGQKIAIYREARREAGHAGDGIVSVMLHAFVGPDEQRVRELVREPMIAYLASSLSLVKGFATTWAAFKRRADGSVAASDVDLETLDPRELRELLEFSFERYYAGSALLGTPETCVAMVRALAAQGVDDIACLIDFGVDPDVVLEHLPWLDSVRATCADLALRGDESIAALLQRHGVTHLQCTPSMARMLLDDPAARTALGGLRTMLLGGEALPEALVARLREATGADLVNMYGPTETTVWSTSASVDTAGGVAIGRPIANTRVYVLDARREPVAVGMEGELWIGGDGVARGYHQRPELTGERFVPDPFDARPGRRMYRTGDRARWRADGSLEYLGRIDHQVKIRGHRIETGEIEAALARQPGIRQAVVTARDMGGDVRLVAYLTLAADGRGDAPPSAASLRAALGATLPEFMLPSHFVRLGSFPLTPNLKIDRKMLPDPAHAEPLDRRDVAAPSTPAEAELAAIFADVLDVGAIGPEESFFDLGGHSILAVQAVRRIAERWDRRLEVVELFRHPSARALAERLGAPPAVADDRDPALEATPAGSRTGDQDAKLLTPAQLRFWLIEQTTPGTPVNNYVVAARLRGPLDHVRLEGALADVQARHPSLRTIYRRVDGEPRRSVLAAPPLAFTAIDLAADDDPSATATALLGEFARQPFDLENGPVLRGMLLRLAEREHVLGLAAHHIAIDGWSFRVLARDLATRYAARAGSTPPPPLAVVMPPRAAAPDTAADLAWWRSVLDPSLPSLELPTSGPRVVEGERAGNHLPIDWPAELTRGLQSIARERGASLYMTVLAVLQAVLHRYANQETIVVGSPIADRADPAAKDVVDLRLHMAPVRVDIDGEQPFAALVERVRDAALAAFEHSRTPFERIVQELHPQRHAGRNPWFDVVFEFDEEVLGALPAGDLTIEFDETPISSGTAKFDLTLDLRRQRDGRLRGWLEYDTSLFDSVFAQDFARRLRTFAEQVVRAPATPVQNVPLFGADELASTALDGPHDPAGLQGGFSIHGAFERQVDRSPGATALVCGEQSVTWRQLDDDANRIAHALRARGAGPDRIVGVSARRTPHLVAALLGVLKSGAAYLPLDPDYPQDRLRLMLADSGAALLLTDAEAPDLTTPATTAVTGTPGVERLSIASLLEPANGAVATRPTPRGGDGDLAYVIYTSGSTGTPKGVMIEHRNVGNLFAAFDRILGEDTHDACWVAVTSISFDISVLELFWTLSRGVRVVLQRDGRDAAELPAALAVRHRATHLQCTPSQARMLLAEPAADRALATLRWLLVGGEALPRDLAVRLAERIGGQIVNVYGPTETTVWSTAFALPRSVPRSIPIGTPLANTTCFVLDARRQPVPDGVIGELWIGGAGVARGYLHRDELTSERFAPLPSAGGEGDGTGAMRAYRTGDLVRRLPDDMLAFVGRADGQVKLRGHRIELGEIEAQLRRQAGVREAVAIVREDQPGDQRLVGYVVAEEGFDAAAARTALVAVLPEWMVPQAICRLDALPLTPNAKIDRRALPAPAAEAGGASPGAYAPPRNDLEERLAAVWRDVLHLARVGIDEDFFRLGGHSLLVLELAERVRAALGRTFSMAQAFVATTIAAQAAALEDAAAAPERVLVPLTSRVGADPIYCLCGVNLYREFADVIDGEQDVVSIYVPEEEALFEAGDVSVAELARAYWAMIRERGGNGAVRLLGFCFGGALAFEVARLAEADGRQVSQLILLDTVVNRRLRRDHVQRVTQFAKRLWREGAGATYARIREVRQQRTGDGDRVAALAQRMGTYEPQGTVRAPTFLIRTTDPHIYSTWRVSEQMGWEGHLDGPVASLVVDGSHLQILRRPAIERVVRFLREATPPAPAGS